MFTTSRIGTGNGYFHSGNILNHRRGLLLDTDVLFRD